MANAQRVLGPLLLILLIVGVGYAVYVSMNRSQAERAAQHAASQIVTVTGLIGSEKKEYLTDPQVLDVLRRNGIDLKVETVGSREMATRPDIKNYDFAFPAGVPGATKIMAVTGAKKSVSPFFTPMAIASWKPIADVLIANGIVRKRNEYYYIIDMKRLLDEIAADKRWRDLSHNPDYAINKSILISTTDVRKSNSAAMYLALASYVFNNDSIVDDQRRSRRGAAQSSQLVPAPRLPRGQHGRTVRGLSGDGHGQGAARHDLRGAVHRISGGPQDQSQRRHGAAVSAAHCVHQTHLHPVRRQGDKLGHLLAIDPDLQRLAVEHGLRTANASDTQAFWKKNDIDMPDTLIDVIDPPSYDILESMIKGIEAKFNS